MCLIGHGAFGIVTKAVWCNYFAVVGIDQDTAYQLMPIVGMFDIIMGMVMLFYPVRAVALWLVFWGILTAAMRPISGEPFAELLERAGNFGAPLALLILCPGEKSLKGWFAKLEAPVGTVSSKTWKDLMICLRTTAVILLAGHGWLNLIEKKGLLAQYTSLGFHDVQTVAYVFGAIELIGAFSIAIKPIRSAVLLLLIWKMGTELFYPHWAIFEWVERGGSYGILLALWVALKNYPSLKEDWGKAEVCGC